MPITGPDPASLPRGASDVKPPKDSSHGLVGQDQCRSSAPVRFTDSIIAFLTILRREDAGGRGSLAGADGIDPVVS